jgi:hypothetical protein
VQVISKMPQLQPVGVERLPPVGTEALGALQPAEAPVRQMLEVWPIRLEGYQPPGLPGSAYEVGSHDVGGMLVQAAAGPVVSHRGPRVRMRGGFLDIAQRDPGIQRCVMNGCHSV